MVSEGEFGGKAKTSRRRVAASEIVTTPGEDCGKIGGVSVLA
jgi:hypothetical protein